MTRCTVLFPPCPFPFHQHTCAQLVMGPGESPSPSFLAVGGATTCPCFIEKVTKPQQVVKWESGKLEKVEQGCVLNKERNLSFFPSTWLCKTRRSLDLTVRQNHHDVALGQRWPCLVCCVNEKNRRKKEKKKKRALLAAALEIAGLQILARLCKGGGAGSRSRQPAEGHPWALCFVWD